MYGVTPSSVTPVSPFDGVEEEKKDLIKEKEEVITEEGFVDPSDDPKKSSKTIKKTVPFTAYIPSPRSVLLATKKNFVASITKVKNCCYRVAKAAKGVFCRLVFAPTFEPTKPHFKEMLERLKNEEFPELEERLLILEDKFCQSHLISRDLRYLQTLHQDIKKPLDRLNYYLGVMNTRPRFPVQDLVEDVQKSFQELDEELDSYCLEKGMAIVDSFNASLKFFTKGGIDLPKGTSQELIQTAKTLNDILISRCQNLSKHHDKRVASRASRICSRFSSVRGLLIQLEKKQGKAVQKLGKARPLELRNVKNSCFFNSVLQCLFAIDGTRNLLSEPLFLDPKDPKGKEKKEIHHELLSFLEAQKINNGKASLTEMELMLFLLQGPSVERLLEKVFDSELHPEFYPKALGRQLDASSVVELFIDNFLPNCRLRLKQHATTDKFPGIETVKEDPPTTTLQIPLRKRSANQTLERLVSLALSKHTEKNERKFDPQDTDLVRVIDEEAAVPTLSLAADTVSEYQESWTLSELPSVLTIQFKRFKTVEVKTTRKGKTATTYKMEKDNSPVILPKNGLLDLTPYSEDVEGTSKKVLYKIKAMVYHGGGCHGGHYQAAVEMDGKYFNCNDTDPDCYHSISKKAFFDREDPYLLFLERVE